MSMHLLGTALAAAFVLATPVTATPLLGSGTTSATFSGTTGNVGGASVPWTGEVFSYYADCLRLAVTAQSTDLLMTAISPAGEVFRDDNSNGNNRPVIRINATFPQGYYSVQLTNRLGQAVDATFTLQVQRLPTNSPTCLPASIPMKGGS